MICILDEKVNSWTKCNYKAIDFNKLSIPIKLKKAVNLFVTYAENNFLLCPTVKLNFDSVILKYDEDNRYIIFTISYRRIEYTKGILGCPSDNGTIYDINEQLKMFSEFIYNKPVSSKKVI